MDVLGGFLFGHIGRKPDGSLYAEELFSTEGFSDVYSLIYHTHPPTQIVQVGDPYSVVPCGIVVVRV